MCVLFVLVAIVIVPSARGLVLPADSTQTVSRQRPFHAPGVRPEAKSKGIQKRVQVLETVRFEGSGVPNQS